MLVAGTAKPLAPVYKSRYCPSTKEKPGANISTTRRTRANYPPIPKNKDQFSHDLALFGHGFFCQFGNYHPERQ